MSRVRACRLVGLNRSSLNYQSKRPDDSTVRQRLRELAAERRRFGYRRLGWLLAREGHVMNRKKLYRIYREEKLMVRRRGRRKRALGTRAPLGLPDAINRRWSLDFVSDAFSDGRRFRIFCVVDDFSRECLATVVDTSIGGVRVVRELERVIVGAIAPRMIVSDNSVAVLRWATDRGWWHYIEPGKPVQNAFVESSTAASRRMSQRACIPGLAEARKPSRRGATTTIGFGRIRASERSSSGSSQTSKGTLRLSKLGAPRGPSPLLHRSNRGKTPTDSTYECE